ncbi:integrator complex subunit 3 [Coemansia reversa NRRL 1564]|uniref:Integrator complex subunit 3 n=1 Tax=Coemansia reversa (strain ATCC 12441 / NRRL 1564) TaxID=763665 RepID=A0A2G5B1B4_COERN|nr:integrator complex subunit 3 [Coemansia reversa NRRL 1564]|eukprot:PIA12800.1 integrator complex subunit 3 [Coemansia reversa NRRL 1564]
MEASEYLRQLSIVSRDGFAQAIGRLQLISNAGRFGRVRETVRTQLFWLLGELVRMNAHGVEQVALALTRQMRGGDVTSGNIRLCTQLLDFLQKNYSWLMTQPLLIATTAYAFGRVILDHTRHTELRSNESSFVVRLLRERFSECAMIGRDLIRMLQDAARVPAFAELWRDLLQSPQKLSTQLTSIEQILRVPTPRVFLANRLTVEMERRLVFILEHVPVAGFTRNLMWFVQRYLSTPESETLYSDLVRFVVGVVHPPNAVLASNVVPRYVFLGALLRFVRSQVVAANVKLALFYDWLCYDPQRDSIMNIEPGVLLIARSIDRYAYLTASLVEFLSFVVDAYAPALATVIHRSIGLVMLGAVEKGVLPSLTPVCEHPRIDTTTRRQLHHLFPQLVPPVSDTVSAGDSVVY